MGLKIDQRRLSSLRRKNGEKSEQSIKDLCETTKQSNTCNWTPKGREIDSKKKRKGQKEYVKK